MNSFRVVAVAAVLSAASVSAFADAAESLRAFVKDVKSGQSTFTQTVTSPDGAKKKVSSGSFSFARPNRFRFDYAKPYAQTIVSDGQKVWFHDPDLNQVTVRKMGDALGSTPVALLTGSSIEKTFDLKAQPDQGGLEWVMATPKDSGGTIQWLKAGFRGKGLVAVEIADSFGQRSLLTFDKLATDVALAPEAFRFAVPPGADVSEQ
ncbi:outer membrane lipoprotein chaperone LolA [Ideonella sp. YS5]|uniref:outer membrane lipoprotein chaperone LolA n=1 Tax=Ideonella sp. YS5 TaxID=3453714 RepID=UPI003EF02569